MWDEVYPTLPLREEEPQRTTYAAAEVRVRRGSGWETKRTGAPVVPCYTTMRGGGMLL
jgi:hypothetical protein